MDLSISIIVIIFIFFVVLLVYMMKIKRARKEIAILEDEIIKGKKEREKLKKLKKDVDKQTRG